MLGFGRSREKTRQGLARSRSTWFGRLAEMLQRGEPDDATWEEVEEALIGADVGVATTHALLERVRRRLREDGRRAPEPLAALKEEVRALLGRAVAVPQEQATEARPKPLVLLMVGVNGTGKTTSIAKLAALFREDGKRVVLAAADTFRAAAIEQLQAWGRRAGAEVIAHRQGADPAAVAFDAYQAARARGADVLMVDTAGRLHTRSNLMEELRKVHRVLSREDSASPHQVLLVLDATTGQNGLAQARAFMEAVSCTGIVLAKLDGTARGGVVLAIADQLGLPVLYIGTGEGLEDLAPFDPDEYVEALLAPDPQDGRP